jgi:hypothetical protein
MYFMLELHLGVIATVIPEEARQAFAFILYIGAMYLAVPMYQRTLHMRQSYRAVPRRQGCWICAFRLSVDWGQSWLLGQHSSYLWWYRYKIPNHKFLITKFLITKFLIDKVSNHKVTKFVPVPLRCMNKHYCK